MATTTNFNWSTPDDTSLVKDGAAAIRTLGSSIDTSMAELKGGTTGQVLSKTSNTDMDFTWVTSAGDIEGVTAGVGISGGGTTGTVTITNSMATAIDAKGDLVAGTGADAFSRLAVGTNGQVLKANSATATGLEWGSAAATGAGCQATLGGQGVSSGTQTALVFNVEIYDTDAYHDNVTNNTRFTIPTGKGGIYVLTGTGQIGGTTGGRAFGFRKNGSIMTNNSATTFGQPLAYQASFNITMVDKAVAGDYYEMYCEQTTGSTQTITAVFSLGYLGA